MRRCDTTYRTITTSNTRMPTDTATMPLVDRPSADEEPPVSVVGGGDGGSTSTGSGMCLSLTDPRVVGR